MSSAFLHGLPGFLLTMALLFALIATLYVHSKNDDDDKGGFA